MTNYARRISPYAGPVRWLLSILVLGVLAVACTTEPAPTTVAPVTITVPTTSIPSATTSMSDASPPTTTTTTMVVPTTTRPLSELVLGLVEVDSGFNRPVFLAADPGGGHDFVVEQPGRIVRADSDVHRVALDIRDDVRFQGEQGLLGLAFHPEFGTNALAYINFTDNRGRTIIRQYEVRSGTFEPASATTILVIDQPAGNHNGGMIAFGPRGHLWIGMGDGGAANDRFNNGQNPETLLGSMLRITVPGTGGAAYDIPASNPFSDGAAGAPEVYWTGLRNPWRFAFDPPSGDQQSDVWVADVGQGDIEEVSVVGTDATGANLGWPVMEGSECFRNAGCDTGPFVLPVIEYGHDDGCSITGGYVYRGVAMPELAGHYFYSDFCTGFIRSYSKTSGVQDWTEMTGRVGSVSSFGIGGDGELYVVSHDGAIHRIARFE